MGQPPAPRLSLAVAATLLAVLTAGVVGAAVTGGRPGAGSPTTVVVAVGAVIHRPGGAAQPATTGSVVPRGAVVSTGSAGSAELVTAGRRAWLGPASALAVGNGTQQTLRQGSLVVDGRAGPPVTITAGDLSVQPAAASAVRVDANFATRVAVLIGSAAVSTTGGRQLAVPGLYQVLATGAALPATTSPLQLTDDALERAVVPGLVEDDVLLQEQAAGLDAGPPAVLTAAVRTVLPAGLLLHRAGPPSEVVLPLAIARAAGPPAGLPARYALAHRLRSAGGSWGVVAHLLGTTALRVGSALNTLLSAAAPTTGPAVAGGPGPAGAGPPVLAAGPPGAVSSPRATGAGHPAGAASGAAARSSSARPSPTSPPTSPPPAGPLQQLVDTVRHLLPSPSAGLP